MVKSTDRRTSHAPVRRLAAILAADVAGYSRLMGADEEGTHERLKAHLRELIEPKIGEHRGRVVKNTGDGLLAEFQSVVDAVRCAVEMQRGMAERNKAISQEKRVEFRIGVNLGDVIAEEHDIFGDGVNVAARLEALAEPGGICVSSVVRDQVRDRLDTPFEDMGEQQVKNIARPVRVYALRSVAVDNPPASRVVQRNRRGVAPAMAFTAVALVIPVAAWWGWSAIKTPGTGPAEVAVAAASPVPRLVAPRLSIVVLPLANLSNDPEQEYFADAITEDLTTDLSRIAHMFVISRNSAFTYKNKPINAKQIGRELGVRYVLEGSTQQSAKQIRINVQLIAADTAAHLWAERFDRDLGDLFALQDNITRGIADALNAQLIAAEAARPTEHPDALDYILRGRAAEGKGWTRENSERAISFFEQALTLNPRSAEAQTWLARELVARIFREQTNTSAADITRAEELIERSLATSPGYALAHSVKGDILRIQGRCPEAIPEFERAIATDPNLAGAYGARAR